MISIYYAKWDGRNGSHELLRRAAADWCSAQHPADMKGEVLCSCAPQEFLLADTDHWQKPYFLYPPGVEFSISHTGDLWMCAISRIPVGLDVQEERELAREKLSRRFFHPREDAWLKAGDYRAFFEVWAAKESYLKYTGDGLRRGMDTFCVVDENGFLPLVDGICQTRFCCDREKKIALCVSFQGDPGLEHIDFHRIL